MIDCFRRVLKRGVLWGATGMTALFGATTPVRSLRVVEVLPHDPAAFTQCLLEHPSGRGELIEGTGLYGRSELRRVLPENGAVLHRLPLDRSHFGEGCAVLNGELYQLTWKENVVMVRDLESFREKRRFRWGREGWGAAAFGDSLWISDGSDTLFVLSSDGKLLRKVAVRERGKGVGRLNELEEAGERVIANIWGEDRIAVIRRETGEVEEWWDASPLRRMLPTGSEREIDVLNGVARASRGGWWLTGKWWPFLFRVIPEQSLTEERN